MSMTEEQARVEAIALAMFESMTAPHERPWDERLELCYKYTANAIIAADPATAQLVQEREEADMWQRHYGDANDKLEAALGEVEQLTQIVAAYQASQGSQMALIKRQGQLLTEATEALRCIPKWLTGGVKSFAIIQNIENTLKRLEANDGK